MTRLGLLFGVVALVGCGSDGGPKPQPCDPATNPCTNPAAPVCDPATHTCVASGGSDGGGSADLSVPDGASPDLTPQCSMSSQCSDLMPICGGGACRGCTGAADDAECAAHKAATPRCDSASHACVACRASTQDSDCATTAPVCDTGVCRKCKAHAECTSLVCKDDGTCASAADILYVDNKGGGCTGTHTGAPTDPFCDIHFAVSALAGQHYIRVIGSLAPYGVLALANVSITLVGPGGKATPPVKITAGGAAQAIDVQAGSSVVIDGFEVASGTQDGIDCFVSAGNSTLTIKNTYVHAFGGFGINANKCPITLDRNQIGPANVAGGINISTTTYNITNCIVTGNGTQGPGIVLSSNSTGTFRHNTVTNNASTVGGPGGVDCGNTLIAKSIENSIFWNNSKDNTLTPASQIGARCLLVNSDIDETITGNKNVAPDFVAPAPGNDFHLNGRTANNLACCIDQITSSPVDHDYDGTPRPINVKWDIGAHEVP